MRWPCADTCDAAGSGRAAACWLCAGAIAHAHNAALNATRCQVDDFMGRHSRRRSTAPPPLRAAKCLGEWRPVHALRGCVAASAFSGLLLEVELLAADGGL